MSPIPPAAYQPTSPTRVPRPSNLSPTTQQPARYGPTTPFRTPPPPPPIVTTQPVSYYKPTTPFKATPPLSVSPLGRAAKFLSKIPKGGGTALAIAFELLFPPPVGDNYYDRNPKNPPPKYKQFPPEPPQEVEPPSYPFRGGQGPNVNYEIKARTTPKTILLAGRGTLYDSTTMAGRITEARIEEEFTFTDSFGRDRYRFYIVCANDQGHRQRYFIASTANSDVKGAFVLDSVNRASGLPDTFGDPLPTAPGVNSAPGNSLGAPIAAPPTSAPIPVPSAPPTTAPSPSPGTTPGVEPPPKRHPGPIPIPIPNPGSTPQPNKYPDPTPAAPDFFPHGDPSPTPGVGVGSPNPAPTPTPGVPQIQNPTIFNPRIYTPGLPLVGNPLTPNPLPVPAPFTPNILQPNPLSPSPFTPNPNTGNPEPKAPPLVTPNKSPDPKTEPNEDLGKQIGLGVGVITTILAGITALVQPGALQSAANAGTCQAFAPGGCAAPVANNAAAAATNSANNNLLLNSIMAFLQALLIPIKAGVDLVNTKLGPVMSGFNGIGGFLARTAEAAKIDKVLGAMNTILLLHNAAMLSRNLGSTLGDLTSSALATIGIKDSEGAGIDVNEILGKQANNFMSSLLGAEVWAGTKTSWNKASSIISSATNIMYTVRSMFDSTREILEWTAENTGKIGNALKRFRVVGENAYKWLPERVTVQNRFTRQIDRIREGIDSLDDAASSLSGVLGEVQSIQQEYADLQEQKQKFDTNIKDLTPKPREENKPVVDAVVVAKTASVAPSGIESVFRGEGETNA